MSLSLQSVLASRKLILVVALPLLLLPILFVDDGGPKFRCLYCILLIATLWGTESLPLPVTSLLPVLLLPLFGILDTGRVVGRYMTDAMLTMLGGIMIGSGFVGSRLHLRIALRLLIVFSGSEAKFLLGIMITSGILAMGVSAPCVAVVMGPIAIACVEEAEMVERAQVTPESVHLLSVGDGGAKAISVKEPIRSKKNKRAKKIYLLAIYYSAQLIGTGIITATPPGLIFQDIANSADVTQGGKYLGINYLTWLAYNFPGMVLNIAITWAYLSALLVWIPAWRSRSSRRADTDARQAAGAEAGGLGTQPRSEAADAKREILQVKYDALGPMTWHETGVVLSFLTFVLLLITREPGFTTGWAAALFPHSHATPIGDPTVAVFVVALMFIVPRRPALPVTVTDAETLLDWPDLLHSTPWGIVFIIGAGFALAEASAVSGLTVWISSVAVSLEGIEPWLLVLLVIVLMTLLSELVSNSLCANLFLPILLTMARRMGLHPMYLTVGAAQTCNYATMLLSSSPLAFIISNIAEGDLTIMDLIKYGAFVDTSCILVTFVLNVSYGNWFFSFDSYEYPPSLDG